MSAQQPITINLGHSLVIKRADDIIQANATDYDYTVKEIKQIHQTIKELTGDKRFLLLLNGTQFAYLGKDVREYIATPTANKNIIAKAFVVKSIGQQIVLSAVNANPGFPVPVNMFRNIDNAVRWLHEQGDTLK